MKVVIDEEAVKNLSRSFGILPQFYSVIIDPVSKEPISGVHRREALKASKQVKEFVLPDGFIEGLAKKLGVTREMMVVIIRQHLNIQRQVKEDETKSELLDLARGFEALGVKKELIAQHVVKVSGLSESRTLALLPDEYKQKEKVAAGKVSAEVKAVIAQEQKREKVEGVVEPTAEQTGTAGLILTKKGSVVVHGTRPPLEPKRNLVAEFTKSLTDFIIQLNKAHVHVLGERYVAINKWSCRKCKKEYAYVDPAIRFASKRVKDMIEVKYKKCPKGHTDWEQVQLKLDALVEVAGRKISIEAEGAGTASNKPERDKLLAECEQHILVFHAPNEFLNQWGWKFAEFLALVSQK